MVKASGNGAASAEGMESGWTCLTGNLLAPLVVPGEPEQKRERYWQRKAFSETISRYINDKSSRGVLSKNITSKYSTYCTNTHVHGY